MKTSAESGIKQYSNCKTCVLAKHYNTFGVLLLGVCLYFQSYTQAEPILFMNYILLSTGALSKSLIISENSKRISCCFTAMACMQIS